MITEEAINNRYISKQFINNPKNQSNITILFNKQYFDEPPFFSIIMPIYNQEEIIANHIQSILDNTTHKYYEIILILDCCSDNTEETVLAFANKIQNPLLTKILILKSDNPLFETAADNLGFFCAQGTYVLEIQADMMMTDPGYNMKLLKPFLQNESIIGISGRCCHDYACTSGIGKIGQLIERTLKEIPNIDADSFYTGETCNRGPLLIDLSKLRNIGYLDEQNYYLDNSDHDLFARAYYQKGWICGYVPIDFIALLKNGSTKKPRDKKNEHVYQMYKKAKTGSNGFLNTIKSLEKRPIKQYKLID